MEEINIKYPLAKQDHLIQQLPQFRVIKKGAKRKGVVREYYSRDKKTKVIIKMFEELDIYDQDLLLVILAIALPISRGNELNINSLNNKELWGKLSTQGIFAEWNTLCIETNYNELCKELNKSKSGTNYQWIAKSLDRLSNTTIKIDTPDRIGGTNFISYEINKTNKKIIIAINPISSMVLLGDKKGFILHNRKERLSLKTIPARALYSILVGLVNQKESRTLSVFMLIEKIHLTKWEDLDKNQRKNFKKSFKTAFEEIDKLDNWSIIDNLNNTITIKRLKSDVTNPL